MLGAGDVLRISHQENGRDEKAPLIHTPLFLAARDWTLNCGKELPFIPPTFTYADLSTCQDFHFLFHLLNGFSNLSNSTYMLPHFLNLFSPPGTLPHSIQVQSPYPRCDYSLLYSCFLLSVYLFICLIWSILLSHWTVNCLKVKIVAHSPFISVFHSHPYSPVPSIVRGTQQTAHCSKKTWATNSSDLTLPPVTWHHVPWFVALGKMASLMWYSCQNYLTWI